MNNCPFLLAGKDKKMGMKCDWVWVDFQKKAALQS